MQLGISEVLSKPVSRSTLLDSLIRLNTGQGPIRLTPTEAQIAADEGFKGLTNVRVLLAEDNPLNQQVARELLTDVGVQVTVAANGRIAVEMAQAQPFDAILMDMQMPEMNGLDATRTLQEMPGWDNTPIIAMTANAMTADRQLCLDAGMVDFVAKPIEPEHLFKTLLRWTRKSGSSETALASKLGRVPSAATFTLLPAHIEGLDLEAGLRRVMHREDRYLALLKSFVAEQSDAAERIVSSLAQGDTQGAQRAAHTLKGLAGTIGAHALYDAAHMLEESIGGAMASGYLAEVAYSLKALIEALHPVLDLFAERQASTAEDTDPVAKRQAMDVLLRLLSDDDANAQRHFEEQAKLFATMLGEHYLRIKSAMNSLALDEAMELLEALPSKEATTKGI
jgi:two-component system sensor histidine kinase/response regulator